MLKYYEHLLKIKLYLKQAFNLDVLKNISDFPLNTDTELSDYYEKIAERIESPSTHSYPVTYNDRYYVQKVKPFFVNQQIYYEVTFTAANANASKFDRVIAFTRHEIVDNYAVKFSIHNDMIRILDKDMSILVIDGYEVSIRPCEWDNLSEIFGPRVKHSTSSNEYRELMRFLSVVRMSLTELVGSDQDYYDVIKSKITERAQSTKIYEMLDQCRDIIICNNPGANVLRYLLHKMNNRVIKWQYWSEQCGGLSNLYLNYGCIPFDRMPYCTSLRQHNPRIYDLFESIPVSGHEHELFARYIKNNTEIEGHLFTPKNEIDGFEDIDGLIRRYSITISFYFDVGVFEFSLHAIREFAPKATLSIVAAHNTLNEYFAAHSGGDIDWIKATLEISYERPKHCTLTTKKTANTESNNNKNRTDWANYLSGTTNAAILLDFFSEFTDIAGCGGGC